MPSALSILMVNEVYKGTVHAPWQAENGVGGSTELMGPSFLQLSSHPRRLSTSHASWALLLLPAMGKCREPSGQKLITSSPTSLLGIKAL